MVYRRKITAVHLEHIIQIISALNDLHTVHLSGQIDQVDHLSDLYDTAHVTGWERNSPHHLHSNIFPVLRRGGLVLPTSTQILHNIYHGGSE